MEYLIVFMAAFGAFVFGAIWYSLLSKPWMAAAGIKRGDDGKPIGGNMFLPFVLSGIAMLLVSGMMRHMFNMADIHTVGKGLTSGLGVGLFFHFALDNDQQCVWHAPVQINHH